MGADMLDTYTLVKRLTQAGVPEAQAEAHMAVFLDMSERGFATKGDIEDLKRCMADFATSKELREVRRDVETLTSDVVGLKNDVAGLKRAMLRASTAVSKSSRTMLWISRWASAP